MTREEAARTCEWEEEAGAEYWNTECGGSFSFFDAGPAENGFKFCPYCGGALTAKEQDNEMDK